ncbi:hypothetical protein ACSVH5_07735 [Flavobacterium sp. RSSA_27]|uniref:hypothetical protein n=1 Tax=Flavobacterium sp. RSSA_27 TaxID=3447667 RepID=UPI003F2A310E
MKKLLLVLALLPFIGFSQTKNMISSFRIFAKPGKSIDLEKALSAHAQRYHTGDWKWRVFEIQSGPDAGGYHIVEGPNSWSSHDSRGTLGDAHTADWVKNVEVLTEGRGSSSYAIIREDLSTVKASDFVDKISISHIYPKQGEGHKVEARLKKLKKVWEASGQSVVVYEAHFSGPPQFSIVYRHKEGWKEKEPGFRKPMKERYESIYGEGSYEEWLNSPSSSERSWGELLLLNPKLGSN